MNVALRRRLIAPLLALALLVSCACASVPPEPAPLDPPSVYAAVLKQRVAPGAIVRARTVAPLFAQTPLPKGVPAGLLEEFSRATSGPQITLVAGQDLPVGTTTASEQTLSGGATFDQAFPGANGLVELSKVAIDPAAGTALVYFSHVIGPVNGGGYLVLLRWKRGVWYIEKLFPLWFV